MPSCANEQFGCCDDNTTAAHGPNKEGCCLYTQYGCCPDNILPANGSNLQGTFPATNYIYLLDACIKNRLIKLKYRLWMYLYAIWMLSG